MLFPHHVVSLSFYVLTPFSCPVLWVHYNILGNKVLQMTDAHRIRLKNKMSVSYGRYTQEEQDAGLVPD
jgi:hypothetical protein